MITLTLKQLPPVPLEAETIRPDDLLQLDRTAIGKLPLMLGNTQVPLEEFFAIDGQQSDQIEMHGDLHKVKWIGKGMTRGSVRIVGNAGMHLGSGMRGGRIEVTGNVSDWLGAEMLGGTIRVHGNAGGQIGAAYRGGMAGMREGFIDIGGAAGLEVGMRMKRGTIVIRGKVRDFAGLQMKGGTIVLAGGAEIRTGAWMIRGTIIALKPIKLLPTFNYSCDYQPTFLNLYRRFLSGHGLSLPADGVYQRYCGDSSGVGLGEILQLVS